MRWALPLGALLVAGCASRHAASTPQPSGDPFSTGEMHPACAALLVDPPACEAAPEAGTSPDTALDWWEAARGDLWHGRLLCPSGASPTVHRVSVSGPSVTSKNPPSPMLAGMVEMGGGELADRWTIACPGDPDRVWYTNLYHCGDPCLPKGFRVLPKAVDDQVDEAWRALNDHQAGKALAAAGLAVGAAEDAEPPWRVTYHAALAADAPDLAVSALLELERMRPGDPDLLVRHALLAMGTGDVDGFTELVLALQMLVGSDHPLAPEVACLEAGRMGLMGAPDDDVDAAMTAACAAGSSICCGQKTAPTP